MRLEQPQWQNYVPGLLTALVWGTTFAASKQVLSAGVSPLGLMLFRFVVAYVALVVTCRFIGLGWMPQSGGYGRVMWRDELRLAALGITGGSLYFLLEYEALGHASSADVGVIVSTVPVVTTAILVLMGRTRIGWLYVVGSALALLGVVLVCSPSFSVEGSHAYLGYLLAFGAVLCWALYTILLRSLAVHYHSVFISRRLFFYAMVSMLPLALWRGTFETDVALFAQAQVLLPALYLGVVASGLCVWLWNVSVNTLGTVRTNNMLYLLTVIPLIASVLLTNEELSLSTWCGALLILLGIVISDRDKRL